MLIVNMDAQGLILEQTSAFCSGACKVSEIMQNKFLFFHFKNNTNNFTKRM